MMSWRDISVTPPACLGVRVTFTGATVLSGTAEFSATHPVLTPVPCLGIDTLPCRPDSTRTPRRRASRRLRSGRSEEQTSELQSLMRNSYAVFCLNKKKKTRHRIHRH